ncbi:hypothetical protein VULLAG_LOCUS14769 [Vulpes lagopus]
MEQLRRTRDTGGDRSWRGPLFHRNKINTPSWFPTSTHRLGQKRRSWMHWAPWRIGCWNRLAWRRFDYPSTTTEELLPAERSLEQLSRDPF